MFLYNIHASECTLKQLNIFADRKWSRHYNNHVHHVVLLLNIAHKYTDIVSYDRSFRMNTLTLSQFSCWLKPTKNYTIFLYVQLFWYEQNILFYIKWKSIHSSKIIQHVKKIQFQLCVNWKNSFIQWERRGKKTFSKKKWTINCVKRKWRRRSRSRNEERKESWEWI